MNSFREIMDVMIQALENRVPGRTGLQTFADEMKVPYVTAQVWRSRKRIHYDHHEALEALAVKLDVPDVTVKSLGQLYKARKPKAGAQCTPIIEGVAA